MDPKLLLLLFVAAIAARDNCGWKNSSYKLLLLELILFRFDKDGICSSLDSFQKRAKTHDCFSKEEKLIFQAFNESCESKCDLYKVMRKGQGLVINLSVNTKKHWTCMNFPVLEKTLKDNECHELHDLLHLFARDCDEPSIELKVNLTDKAV